MKISKLLLITAATLFIPCLAYANIPDDNQDEITKTLDMFDKSKPPVQLASASSDETSTVETSPIAVTPSSNAITPPATTEAETNTLFGNLLKKYDITPSGSVTLDYYSRYVWRGEYLDKDGVFEPGITLSAKGFSVGYWSNWDMVGSDPLNSNESDYFVSYAYTEGPLTITGGHTWYSFPGTSTSSKEYFVSAGLSTFLSPVFTFYHDYEDGKDLGKGHGNYYSLALSNTMDIYKPYGISLTLGTTIGYIDHQWINGRGFHFTPTMAINIPMTKSLTISPTIGYNITQGDLKDPAIGNQTDSAFGGVHSVVTF